MKLLVNFRKILFFVLPCIAYTIFIAPIYTVSMHSLTSALQLEQGLSMQQYFYNSFWLVIPFLALSYIALKSPNIWVYLLLCILVIALTFIISGDGFFLALAIIYFGLKLIARITLEPSILDSIPWATLFVFAVFYIFCGFLDQPYIQYISIHCFASYGVISFTYFALKRMTDYIEVNKKMNNLPAKFILKGNTLVFACLFPLLIATSIIFIDSYNSFVKMEINLDFEMNVEEEINKLESDTSSSGNNGNGMGALPEGETWWGWNVIGFFVSVYIFYKMGIFLFKWLLSIVKDFKLHIKEQDDVIESTLVLDDTKIANTITKENKLKFFDFSPNTQIRKKYFKAIKRKSKQNPEKWQSPAEIESSSGLDIPILHNLYEKARYSESGCDKNDIKKI